MDFDRVAIIGADWISVSIALGLKALAEPPEVIGYDPDAATIKRARSLDAFDQTAPDPGQACEDADLVIVALALPAVQETFAAIAAHLRPGCLVTDTAHLKAPVMRWAKKYLPQDVHFIGGHLIPNPAVIGFDLEHGLDSAAAELLRGALYCLTPPAGVSGAALDALIELVGGLEAQPLLIDVAEHDGLQAGVEGLPDLLAIALVRATVDTPGWQEMRKFAGYRFGVATEAAGDARARRASTSLNRENILHRLNAVIGELVRLRDILEQDDPASLEEIMATAAEGRARWIAEREHGMWIEEVAVDMDHVPTSGERLGQIILGNVPSWLVKESDRSGGE